MKKHLFLSYLVYLITIVLTIQPASSFAQSNQLSDGQKTGSTPLDKTIQLNSDDEVISSVFKDVVVVQRKAKKKAGKILFNFGLSFDFSDGPITMWAVNTNIGYAFSNSYELYLHYVPSFIVNERSIVGQVKQLQLVGGQNAILNYSRPESAYGLDFLWLPAYGKDSFGPHSIVRSDSFVKINLGVIKYVSGSQGNKSALLIGKTYFLADQLNMRVAGGFAQFQTELDGRLSNSNVALLEGGFVFYF